MREKHQKTRDPDFINAEIAIKRAAQKAREKARSLGTGVVLLKDGRVVEESPETAEEGKQ